MMQVLTGKCTREDLIRDITEAVRDTVSEWEPQEDGTTPEVGVSLQ